MSLYEERRREILRSECPYCGAAPGKLCTTKKGLVAYYPHADRGKMDAHKSKVVLERHGLRWESRNGEVWLHERIDEIPSRYRLLTIVNLKSIPHVLVTGRGPGRQVATFEDALAEAPLMIAQEHLLDTLNRRIEQRIVMLETRFGHLLNRQLYGDDDDRQPHDGSSH